jgi:hypothetical protein
VRETKAGFAFSSPSALRFCAMRWPLSDTSSCIELSENPISVTNLGYVTGKLEIGLDVAGSVTDPENSRP